LFLEYLENRSVYLHLVFDRYKISKNNSFLIQEMVLFEAISRCPLYLFCFVTPSAVEGHSTNKKGYRFPSGLEIKAQN